MYPCVIFQQILLHRGAILSSIWACRNRGKAVAAFQTALREFNSSKALNQLALATLDEPATLSGLLLRQTAATAAKLLASARKHAASADDASALEGSAPARLKPRLYCMA